MKRNTLLFAIILSTALFRFASAGLPDSLRPDWDSDSNGVKKFWQTGDIHQDYHRIVTDGARIFVANGSTLQRLELPFLSPNPATSQTHGGYNSIFDTVRFVGSWEMPARIEDLQLQDSVLMVALGKKGLRIYAFRQVFLPDNAPPLEEMVEKVRDTSFAAYTIGFHQDHFYVGTSDGVRSYYYDRLGFLRTDGGFSGRGNNRHIAFYDQLDRNQAIVNNDGSVTYPIRNSYAFLADSNAGYRILDITYPDQISFLGWLPTPALPRGIIVRDTLAYAMDRDFGFRVYNIADPVQTKLLGSWNLDGEPNNFILTEPSRVAFIASGDHSGLRIVGAIDPLHFHEVGFYETPGTAYDVMLASDSLNLVLVADGRYLGLYDFTESVDRINTILQAYYPAPVLDQMSSDYAYTAGYPYYTGYYPSNGGIPIGAPSYYPFNPHNKRKHNPYPEKPIPVKPPMSVRVAPNLPAAPSTDVVVRPPRYNGATDTAAHPLSSDVAPAPAPRVKPTKPDAQKPVQVVTPAPVMYTPVPVQVQTPPPQVIYTPAPPPAPPVYIAPAPQPAPAPVYTPPAQAIDAPPPPPPPQEAAPANPPPPKQKG